MFVICSLKDIVEGCDCAVNWERDDDDDERASHTWLINGTGTQISRQNNIYTVYTV